MTEASPSSELLQAVVAGNESARRALIQAWGPTVLAWCARLGGPGIDAEDAAQEVVLHLLDALPALSDARAFPAWLFRITRTVLARERRQAWVRRRRPGAPPDISSLDDPYRDALAADVRAALEAMPQTLREVLVLCEVEARTDKEAAALLGIPPGTLKSRLRRARQAFEREVRRRGLLFDEGPFAECEWGNP